VHVATANFLSFLDANGGELTRPQADWRSPPRQRVRSCIGGSNLYPLELVGLLRWHQLDAGHTNGVSLVPA
jgi:uncharacterized protein (DUF2237 family)